MAKPKFDFVVEAVHYSAEGRIGWVRGYERRGPTFSDLVIVDREGLLDRLRGGERVMTGRRIPQMASTFEISGQVQIDQVFGQEFLVSGAHGGEGDRDNLQGVPRI